MCTMPFSSQTDRQVYKGQWGNPTARTPAATAYRSVSDSAITRFSVLGEYQDLEGINAIRVPLGYLGLVKRQHGSLYRNVQDHKGIYRVTLPEGKWSKMSDLGSIYTGCIWAWQATILS